ncbi:MAG: hypothetical protein AABX11_02380 [Nanoarchaeota archaeon]
MIRKLIGQGLGGMTIHLPKKWIEAYHLSKGDDIYIDDAEGKLIISPKSQKLKRETTIKLIGLEESLIRILIGNTYRLGFDKIVVEFESEKQFEILQEVIQKRTIGFEIVKKENKKCIVENVTEPSEDQFDNILLKIFMNIDELFEETSKRLNLVKGEKQENIDEIEDRIIRYDQFCRRILLKKRFEPKSSLHLAFILMIIHGQRELYYLTKAVSKENKFSKETLALFSKILELYRLVKEAYLAKESSQLAQINKQGRDIIYKKGYSLIEKTKGKESIIIYHLLACARNFYQSVSSLSGLLL